MNEEEKQKSEEKPQEKPKEEPKQKEVKEEKPAERPSTCAKCAKRLNRKSWYYRNGKYYCNKRCWKATKSASQQTQG